MVRLAIAHCDLSAKGGGESVCMHTLDALQDDYDISLLTLTEPNWHDLNRYYNTDVHNVAVISAPLISRLLDCTDHSLYNLRLALLNRHLRRHAANFDLIVGTDNEVSVATPTIQYIHTPRFGRLVTTKRVGEDRFIDHLYDRLSYIVGRYDVNQLRSSHVLTNSRFMANIVQDAYGIRPRVVYPPIDTQQFTNVPWDEREPGFLTIGRLAPYKNVETTIHIVDGLRDRGHNVHQHIIGPAYDTTYTRRIQTLAESRDYLHVEGEISRAALADLISRHRYGLHGKRNEHFGMAVAELAAGGAIPFVPDSGGQQEIVGQNDHQLYATPRDAIETIDQVLSNPSLAQRLRMPVDAIERRFGRDRFRETIRALVDAHLNAKPGPRSSRRNDFPGDS